MTQSSYFRRIINVSCRKCGPWIVSSCGMSYMYGAGIGARLQDLESEVPESLTALHGQEEKLSENSGALQD